MSEPDVIVLPLQQTSYEIWEKKYQLKDEHGLPVDKTVEDTYERVATALSLVEEEDVRQNWKEKFKWALKNGATPAGRIMSNAGAGKYKPATSLINCTVSQIVSDNMHGILDSVLQAGLTLKAGCGIGYEFSTLRPRGSFVSGAGASTSGPFTFMDIFDAMCFTVSSAGGRRGAQMGTFAVWHPDVEEFIKAKRENGRLRQFNLSLLIDDEFVEAVKANGQYSLVFPVKQSSLDRGIVKGELVKKNRFWEKEYCISQDYIVDEDDKILCEVYRKVNATDLWDTVMKSTYDFSEPGFLLIDRINQYNNNWFCEEIRATNPCLHGDSIIETKDGRVKIKDITQPTMVYSMNKDGSLVLKRASASWKTKENAETVVISVRSGKSICVTPDHKIFVEDSGWVEAKNLKIGDKLVHLCRARRGAAYSGVKLSTEDNRAYRMEHRFIADAVWGISDSDDVHHIDGNTYNNCIENFEVLPHHEHATLTRFEVPNDHMIQGIDGKFISGPNSKNGEKTVIPMPDELRSNMKNGNGACVVKIEKGPDADVYDMTVEDTHNFVANFLVVHNCGEQPLSPEGSCLLGSINVANFVRNPFTSEVSFDWEKYKEVIRVFTRMLDNVVEINGLPLAGQRREIEMKRRHGMGILGVGSALSLLGDTYGSESSIKFVSDLMREMAVEGFEVGIKLAIEKGAAPIFNQYTDNISNKQHWVNSEYMKRIWEVRPELREFALAVGCRFTHHTSIAPTGTISLSLNNNASNGIEPTFAHKYTRNVIVEGKKSKQAVDVYSYELLLYKTLTGKDEVPESFSTTDSVTTYAHVDIQAAAQYWCDSSISKTINVPSDIPFDEFKDIYMYAYDNGLKGCTTFRLNPEAFQGVLVKDEEISKIEYVFVLDNGEEVKAMGNDIILYDGEEHTAANLYDAIKEGYYGKF